MNRGQLETSLWLAATVAFAAIGYLVDHFFYLMAIWMLFATAISCCADENGDLPVDGRS